MVSRSFGTQVASIPHLARNSQLQDLRDDVEAGFNALESQTEAQMPAQANIRLNTNPTAADTVTIGADVYEFVAAIGNQQAGRIGVLIGGTAAVSLQNIIDAINGAALPAQASGKGTVAVRATIYNTDFLHIEPAAFPGGPVAPGPGPNVALSDALTAAVAWDQTNLNLSGYGGISKKAVARIVVNATNLAANFDVVFPFTPYSVSCVMVTNASGVPDAAKQSNVNAAGGLTLVQARNAVTVDLDVGAGTDPVATDIVYIEARGYA